MPPTEAAYDTYHNLHRRHVATWAHDLRPMAMWPGQLGPCTVSTRHLYSKSLSATAQPPCILCQQWHCSSPPSPPPHTRTHTHTHSSRPHPDRGLHSVHAPHARTRLLADARVLPATCLASARCMHCWPSTQLASSRPLLAPSSSTAAPSTKQAMHHCSMSV